ncbi:MAG: hypothetical protein Q7U12_01825 [Undibacterium sp.]|nr:hypothetical protein [Undibacterium sp.]MDO9191614.1 hypothetical protein [Undibacterium sp.]
MQFRLSITVTILIVFSVMHSSGFAKESIEVRFPRPAADIDPQSDYIHAVLKLALKNAPVSYQLKPSSAKMDQARAIYEMTTPNGIVDILWTMSTDEREAQLIPIRIPIDKGLIGWRIPLVKRNNADLLKNVKSLDNLRVFSAGQEQDWPDVPILKANALPVITSAAYEPLFNMLKAGRFDYFPRSIFEILSEYSAHPNHNLYVDQHIILHYPAAFYFFVAPRKPMLAKDLRMGLEVAIKNGRFEKLFQKYHQMSIRKANIKQRVVIELRNPLSTPEKLPMNRPELWFTP